ncbi:MAG: protein kinase [Bryobacteraceae bacterium]
MTDAQWQAAWEVYQSAANVPQEDLKTFLDSATTDPAVRDAVLGLHKKLEDVDPLDRRGQRIGRYVVTERLGGGGNGEVFAARDSDLNRLVALKFLAVLAEGDLPIERFIYEAKAASALNHPNIVTVHEVIHSVSGLAIVMELVEGTPLRRLVGTPMPLDQLVFVGQQIARALHAAHERGIVHCDIKPENLMIRRDGLIKVLDFGLARDSSLLNSRSMLHAGTLRYMAPERSRGETPTGASDIFSLGLVLYELATGVHPFDSASLLDTVEALNHRQADPPSSCNAFVPSQMDDLLLRMLAKEPSERPSAGEVTRSLETHFQVALPSLHPRSTRKSQSGKHKRWWRTGQLAAAAVLLCLLTWAVVQFALPHAQAPKPFVQLDLDVGDVVSEFAVSPDGSEIVLLKGNQLALRPLSQSQLTSLPGTEGASYPFFSPDGKWVAFFAAGKLRKIAVNGGAPFTICDAQSGRGGSWGDDGFIVATLNSTGGLWVVSSSGGVPRPLTSLNGEAPGVTSHRWPQILPRGRGILFTATIAGGAVGSLRVMPRQGGLATTVVENSPYGRVLSNGFLVYYQNGRLFAVPFDLNRLQITGPALLLLDGVAADTVRGATFEASPSGTLVYRRGDGGGSATFGWLTASGQVQQLLSQPGAYLTPRLSPDGHQLAFSLSQTGQQNIWIYGVETRTIKRLTFDSEPQLLPVWTPDGQFIAFRSGSSLAWIRSDGSGKVERLASSRHLNPLPYGFSPDGKWLVFGGDAPGTGLDLFIAKALREGDKFSLGDPRPLLRHAGGQYSPAISPDGRWLAYSSDESGRGEVYVRPFLPDGSVGDAKWQVSTDGGIYPVWSRQGSELFYRNSERYIMEDKYTVHADSFLTGSPTRWSRRRLEVAGGFPSFDLAPDAHRVLGIFEPEGNTPDTDLRVMLNLDAELSRRTSTH